MLDAGYWMHDVSKFRIENPESSTEYPE